MSRHTCPQCGTEFAEAILSGSEESSGPNSADALRAAREWIERSDGEADNTDVLSKIDAALSSSEAGNSDV